MFSQKQTQQLQNANTNTTNTNANANMTDDSTFHGTQLKGTTQQRSVTTNEMNIESITQDALNQVDTQASQAMQRAQQLKQQDLTQLKSSQQGALSQLEQQAAQLKAQVDREKAQAERDIQMSQKDKFARTEARATEEQAAIAQAAQQRKMELESKSAKLQSEIAEITKRKTEEMLNEKPGDLQFVHVHEDTGVKADLQGNVGHSLQKVGEKTVSNTVTKGEEVHNPVKVTKTFMERIFPSATTHTEQTHTNVTKEPIQHMHGNTNTNTASTTTQQREIAESKRGQV